MADICGEMTNWTIDGLVTTRKQHYFVIPVKTGIQDFQLVTKALDTRLRGYDELFHVYHDLQRSKKGTEEIEKLLDDLREWPGFTPGLRAYYWQQTGPAEEGLPGHCRHGF